jgi:hypothetical protein
MREHGRLPVVQAAITAPQARPDPFMGADLQILAANLLIAKKNRNKILLSPAFCAVGFPSEG